jgi:hypothetical protein
MAALIELSESLLKVLEEAGATNLPTIDFAVEACRTCLRKGYSEFLDLTQRTFVGQIEPKGKAMRAYRRFLKINKLHLAELVLSEREV